VPICSIWMIGVMASYLPRHKVGVAGNVLMLGMVYGIIRVRGIYLSVCKF